jgi:hypothetical protein
MISGVDVCMCVAIVVALAMHIVPSYVTCFFFAVRFSVWHKLMLQVYYNLGKSSIMISMYKYQ